MSDHDSRDKLVRTASRLFRRKGYSGVGLAEILAEAKLPKGSLYHHFPGGKRELADAATRWAGKWLEALLNRSFGAAESFEAGALRVCEAIASAVTSETHVPACPVLSILQAVPIEPELRVTAQEVYGRWTDCIEAHASRFGHPTPREAAFVLHIKLQGAWIVAFAQQSNQPFSLLAEDLRCAVQRRPAGTAVKPG